MTQTFKLISLILFTSILLCGCMTSRIYRPREIFIQGDFIHRKTNNEFPLNWDGFNRENITLFAKDSSNIGISYVSDNAKQDIKVSVYIYPAPVAIEYRIRDEYFDCLKAIASTANHGINARQKPVKVSKDGYKVLGLSATVSEENFKTVLVLFECGKYFLKYRITSNNIDTSVLNGISDKLIKKFSPIDIVKQYPLIDSSSIHISPDITTDEPSLDATLACAFAKAKWVVENVDSLERCSGFPSLYFEEQKVAIDSMLNKWEQIKHNNSKFDKFFNDLLLIRNSGYLNEFIHDQYGGVLLLPEGLTLDFDNYEKWKRINPTVRLTGQYYYLIGYEDDYKDKK